MVARSAGPRHLVGAFVAATLVTLFVISGVARAALPTGCTQAAQTITCTYTSGSNAFTVPARVSSISVLAIGGAGGSSVFCTTTVGCSIDVAGGFGARVAGELTVSPGTTIYAAVGVNGANGSPGSGNLSGGFGGAAGGASDVRSTATSLSSRLLVAGGGGGAGAPGLITFGTDQSPGASGGAGGSAGSAGTPGAPVPGDPPSPQNQPAGGGAAGGSTAGGAGGTGGIVTNIGNCSPACIGNPGQTGSLQTGGAGGAGGNVPEVGHVSLVGGGGGAGGGGLFGGGGGGGGSPSAGGGGGGGGSSLVPPGGSETVDSTGMPLIEVTYTAPKDPTATSVSCSPDTIAPWQRATCAATVTDTAVSPQAAPRGAVSFSSTGSSRSFAGASQCALVSAGDGRSATCSVSLTPAATGVVRVRAAYRGDDQHGASDGGTTVTVELPASTPDCRVLAAGQITAADGDRASFAGIALATPPRGAELYIDRGPANPLTLLASSVEAVTCTARHAIVFGTARLARSHAVLYRIDIRSALRAHGEDTYRVRFQTGYDSGAQPLRSGFVQIEHRH